MALEGVGKPWSPSEAEAGDVAENMAIEYYATAARPAR
jgi:hypothetical protein